MFLVEHQHLLITCFKYKSYYHLDSEPRCTQLMHRPAYASDGDYFSKPNAEDIFDEIYSMMRESNPESFRIFIVRCNKFI